MNSYRNRIVRSLVACLAVGMALMLGSGRAMGQASATANGSSTVVPAITITKTSDLQFGLIVAGPGGTVVIGTDGTLTASGPTALSNASYPVTAAGFTVTGMATLAYTITLPTTITLNGPSSSTMSIGNFISNPANTGTIGAGGTSTLAVGGTLTVSSTQTPGAYTGTFNVTVNYQ